MRHDTLSLTSLGRLLFYHNDFDNHLLSLSLLSTGKYICVTGRTQQSLMTRTPSSAKGSSLCSRLLSDGKKRMRFVCVCATKISKHHPSSTHPTLFPSFYSSYSLLSSKLGNTTINCNSPLTLGVHKTNWKKSSIDVIKKNQGRTSYIL